MTLREQYGLSFHRNEYEPGKFFNICDSENLDHSLLAGFLMRLNDDDVPSIIEEINSAVKNECYIDTYITSDPWEDLEVGIDYPVFFIEEFKLPLQDMKMLLLEWLEFVRPGAHEFLEEIEKSYPKSKREEWLLKFKYATDINGEKKNICESLTKSDRPFCFVQYCSQKEIEYLLAQIDAPHSGPGTDKVLLTLPQHGIQIKLEPKRHVMYDMPQEPWFKVGNPHNNNGICVSLQSMKKFLIEWLEFTRID